MQEDVLTRIIHLYVEISSIYRPCFQEFHLMRMLQLSLRCTKNAQNVGTRPRLFSMQLCRNMTFKNRTLISC